METGIVSDRVRLHLLTPAGLSLFKALFEGQEPVIPQAQVHMKDEENFDYLRRQGYWIDELRFHALGFGMDAIPERTYSLEGTGLSVRPDLTIYRGGEGNDVPVQVELGEKSWSTQRAQVTAGIVKSVAVFGRCDVWVESEAMVETLSGHLEKEKDYKKLTGGLPMKAPGQVRFFVLGGQKIRQFDGWPKPEATPAKVVILQ
jgi:hypothetical protein